MSIFGFDLQESVVLIIHVIATIGGAVVGWFVCGPLTRGIYWLRYRAATPAALLFTTKSVGAIGLATAIWFLMPKGEGGGDPGFGPGSGGLPGKGPGKGSETPDADADAKRHLKDTKDKSAQKLDPVEIEIIGEKLYKELLAKDKKERWYVIQRKAYTLDELDAYLKANRTHIEVTPVLTDQSINLGHKELTDLTKKYGIKTLQYKMK